MRIKTTYKFRKSYKDRIRHHAYLVERFQESLHLLKINQLRNLEDIHQLRPPMYPYYSFKIGNYDTDCIVVFRISVNTIILLDIGTHSQVYY